MITVNVKKLVEAIQEADAFALPEMNDGVSYLYNAVYNRLSRGHEVRLSELDFDAFDSEDVDAFSGLYTDVFERNYYAANRVADTLRASVPVRTAVGFV